MGRKNSSLTMAEEIVLVEHIKILSRYLKAREQLEADLGGREPTREEWASNLNISPDELALQMMASARAQVRMRLCVCVCVRARGWVHVDVLVFGGGFLFCDVPIAMLAVWPMHTRQVTAR